jgi:hypothetical protein
VVLCLAIAAAILRYRLYDLDRVISRTVAYGLLTLLLAAAYAVVALGLGQLLGQDSSLAGPARPWPWPPPSSRPAATSKPGSIAASTAAATTPVGPWRGSRPGCATRSTWTPCMASC